jgi:hypothetical protein
VKQRPRPPENQKIEDTEKVSENNEYKYEAALELERRLYESALTSLDQVFAKEGLVTAFLSSGAIVAFAAGLGAVAQMASLLDHSIMNIVAILLSIALMLLILSMGLFYQLLKGREVKDLSSAEEFLKLESNPQTKEEILLQLVVEYKQARENHENLIKLRLKKLLPAIFVFGLAAVVSFVAILIALFSTANSKNQVIKGKNDSVEAQKSSYNRVWLTNQLHSQRP